MLDFFNKKAKTTQQHSIKRPIPPFTNRFFKTQKIIIYLNSTSKTTHENTYHNLTCMYYL